MLQSETQLELRPKVALFLYESSSARWNGGVWPFLERI